MNNHNYQCITPTFPYIETAGLTKVSLNGD